MRGVGCDLARNLLGAAHMRAIVDGHDHHGAAGYLFLIEARDEGCPPIPRRESDPGDAFGCGEPSARLSIDIESRLLVHPERVNAFTLQLGAALLEGFEG